MPSPDNEQSRRISLSISQRNFERMLKLQNEHGSTLEETFEQVVEEGLEVLELSDESAQEDLLKPHAVHDLNWSSNRLMTFPELYEAREN